MSSLPHLDCWAHIGFRPTTAKGLVLTPYELVTMVERERRARADHLDSAMPSHTDADLTQLERLGLEGMRVAHVLSMRDFYDARGDRAMREHFDSLVPWDARQGADQREKDWTEVEPGCSCNGKGVCCRTRAGDPTESVECFLRPNSRTETNMRNDGTASKNEFALGFADGIRSAERRAGYLDGARSTSSNDEHPVTRARRLAREREANSGAPPTRLDAKIDGKTLRARVIEFLRTRADDLSTLSDDDLRRMVDDLSREDDEDDRRTDSRENAYWCGRALHAEMQRRARSRRAPVGRYDSSEEHPVAKARRENYERSIGRR